MPPPPASCPAGAAPAAPTPVRRILLVDDQQALLKATRYVLEQAGYSVSVAADGQTALQLALAAPPDIILLDVVLPDIPGDEVLRRLRTEASLTDTFIVLHSSMKTHTLQQASGLNAGADGYIAKPVSSEELLARLAALLRQKELTEQLRLAEARLQERLHELSELNHKLACTQSLLLQAEKLSAVGQLAAGVAHEINNPISFVAANLTELRQHTHDLLRLIDAYEAAASEPGNVMRQRAVELIAKDIDLPYLRSDLPALFNETEEGIRRVGGIVRDLRDFSHVDASEQGAADLHAGIDSTLNLLRHQTRDKLDIIRDYGDLPPVECAVAQINQVFLNLIVNAIHATAEHGTLTLRTRRAGEFVSIEVQDTGCGIAPENIKRVFEPFFTTKPIGQGTGLGLSLSYGIIQRHGGELSVTSTPGVGSTFKITLPIQASARKTPSR